MIEINNLQLTFNKGEATEVRALKGVSLTIPDSEFIIIIGANGSGKSTLLNAISGTVSAQQGTITIDENSINNLKEFERSKFLARIFQNPLQGTAPELSVLDNFRLAALRTQSKGLSVGITQDFKDRVHEKIRGLKMNLENKLEQQMGTLSGGQRQALTLVMATMDDCKIMLLDEPTAALDPKTSAIVMEKANEIISANKLTAILITQQLNDVIQFGNRVIMMKEGTIFKDILKEEKQLLKIEQVYSWFN